jgi:hypothetical protein
MDDLITWLRAQLDEDGRVAREAAHANPGSAADRWSAEKADNRDSNGIWGTAWAIGPERVKGIVMAICPADILPRISTHIARHDPARVLAEVEAKRRIVDLCWARAEARDGGYEPDASISSIEVDNLWTVVEHLAAVYADRPGYREKWRSS